MDNVAKYTTCRKLFFSFFLKKIKNSRFKGDEQWILHLNQNVFLFWGACVAQVMMMFMLTLAFGLFHFKPEQWMFILAYFWQVTAFLHYKSKYVNFHVRINEIFLNENKNKWLGIIRIVTDVQLIRFWINLGKAMVDSKWPISSCFEEALQTTL